MPYGEVLIAGEPATEDEKMTMLVALLEAREMARGQPELAAYAAMLHDLASRISGSLATAKARSGEERLNAEASHH